MSVVVHVGQCGNQLGDAFWRLSADASESVASASLPKKNTSTNAAKGARSVLTAPRAALPMLYADCFFHPQSRRARCILVDTEPKVIRSVLRATSATPGWRFEPAHLHHEQSGRGNNWAMGYNFQTHQRNVLPCKTSPTGVSVANAATVMHRTTKKKLLVASAAHTSEKHELVDLVMESLRQEIEALDSYRGTMLMHSLGGGTGAGLGCRLLETIRDVYPRSYLGAVSVAPSCTSGDTPLQNYNALFTLQHLQEHTDWVIYKENDELMRSALYWKALVSAQSRGTESPSPREPGDSTRVTLNEMNALVAADVAGLVFPIVRKLVERGLVAQPFDVAKLVHDCCPLPTTKFLDTRTGISRTALLSSTKYASDPLFHAVTASNTRDGHDTMVSKLVRHTAQSFPGRKNVERAIGATAVIRQAAGPLHDGRQSEESGRELFAGVLPHMHLGTSIDVVESMLAPFQLYGAIGSTTIALNNGHASASISHFLNRGQQQFKAGAYIHWYKQYGLEDADFENAFEQCTRIVQHYDEILHP